jgi:hypothetical protein
MDITQHLKLIDGKFTPPEARRVILDLIGSKINFHAVEAFSIRERFNGDVSYSEKRIKELKEARTSLEAIINHALSKGLILKVKSLIEITLVEEN